VRISSCDRSRACELGRRRLFVDLPPVLCIHCHTGVSGSVGGGGRGFICLGEPERTIEKFGGVRSGGLVRVAGAVLGRLVLGLYCVQYKSTFWVEIGLKESGPRTFRRRRSGVMASNVVHLAGGGSRDVIKSLRC